MTRSQITSSQAEGGFTLIELLVSLSLLIIMLALINGSLRFGRRAWEVSDQVEHTHSAGAFRNLLGQRLVEALPLVDWDDRGVPKSTFQGASDYLTFASPMSSRDGLPAGVFLVTLKLAPKAGVTSRPLSLELKLPDGGKGPPGLAGHAPVLIDNVARLAIRYYGPPERGGEPRWSDDWQSQTTLPSLVTVDVQFPISDPRTWPPFAAELKVGSRVQSQR